MIPATLRTCTLREPATASAIRDAEHALGCDLPRDHALLLLTSDGLEGPVGQESYLRIWSVSEQPRNNAEYPVKEALKGVTLLGSDGGNTGYGFRRRGDGGVEYVCVPLIVMDEDEIVVLGTSLETWLRQLR